jgi:hypothetical protein
VRARKDLLQTTAAALLVLLAAAITIPLTEVSSYFPHSVAGNRWLWFGVLIGVAAAIVMLTWLPTWLEKRAPSAGSVGVPETRGWIEREELSREELSELVKALTAAGSEPVALTTGLFGAGGFGKTMLAARACRDRKVRRQFGGRVVYRAGLGLGCHRHRSPQRHGDSGQRPRLGLRLAS